MIGDGIVGRRRPEPGEQVARRAHLVDLALIVIAPA